MIETNYNDIFIRNATIALLNILKSETYIEQVEDGKISKFPVKFMVSAGNSEQFMKDFFTGSPDCDVFTTEGNYETLPFGIIHMPPSIQIITKDLTNKFIRAQYINQGTNKHGDIISVGHSARMMALPLEITFQIEIRMSTINQMFKVFETVMDSFFQNRVVYFQFKGMRIQSSLKFPDVQEFSKAEQFDFSTLDNHTSIKFNVVMETYYPSLDKTSDLKTSEVVERFNIGKINASSNQRLNGVVGDFIDQNS